MPTRAPAPRRADLLRRLIAVAALLLATACATRAPHTPADSGQVVHNRGQRIAQLALAQVGQPYRYGGDSREGFDCSGLTRFVHAQQSIALPRTAQLQRDASRSLQREELVAGDLVFFRMLSRKVDHVGVYVGGGRFVHAPRPGSDVTIAVLADPWFLRHFAGGGRYWDAAAAR